MEEQQSQALVTVEENTPLADSRLIAMELGIEHESFFKMINDYREEIEEDFGLIRFEIGVKSGPQRGKLPRYARLNEDQTYAYLAYSQNTEQARACKRKLVKGFSDARVMIAQLKTGVQLPLRGERLMLPERVTDQQAVEVLSQIEALVKEEQLAPTFRSSKRYNLEFALQKAQKLFENRNLQAMEKQNGHFRIKEYPGETAQEHKELNTEVAYRSLREEHERLKHHLAQVEEELLDLQVIQHHFLTELQEALTDMDSPRIQASLEKIMRWLDHMRIPDASALKLLFAVQEKIVVLLQKKPDGLDTSTLLQKYRLNKDDVEPVLEELVSKNAIRLIQRKVAGRTKRIYRAKGA